MSAKNKASAWRGIAAIQALVFLFSTSSMLTKLSGIQLKKSGLFSWAFIGTFFAALLLIAVYAYFWQKVLKKTDLSVAYLSKGVTLLWTLLWSVCLFGESVTLWNVLGLALVMAGMLIINLGDAAQKPQQAAHGKEGHHVSR